MHVFTVQWKYIRVFAFAAYRNRHVIFSLGSSGVIIGYVAGPDQHPSYGMEGYLRNPKTQISASHLGLLGP